MPSWPAHRLSYLVGCAREGLVLSPHRRRLSIAVFLLLATGFLVGTHTYLARRLVLDPGLPEPWRALALAAIALLGASVVLQPIAERRFPRPLARLVAWPASLWMGLAFLLLVQLFATDALLALAGAAAQAAQAGPEAAGAASGVRAAAVAAVALVA